MHDKEVNSSYQLLDKQTPSSIYNKEQSLAILNSIKCDKIGVRSS